MRDQVARWLLAHAAASRGWSLELMAAANASAEVGRKAGWLGHALQLRRQADALTARALERDPGCVSDPSLYRVELERLHARLGEARFLSLVHHEAQRSRAQLQRLSVRLHIWDPETREVIDAVLADSEEHVRAAAAGDRASGVGRHRVWLWGLGRAWRRAGGALTGRVFQGLTMGLYLLLGPLAWLERSRAR